MTPEQVREQYEVNANDFIVSPGKFEAEHFSAPYFYDSILDGCAESLDWMEDGCGVSADLIAIGADERALWNLEPEDGFVVVVEHDNGFVTLHFYDSEAKARAEWEREPEPQEDDVTTPDHRNFYQWGKLVLSIGEDENMAAALNAWMERERYWPSVWFVSDHGNARLIDLSA